MDAAKMTASAIPLIELKYPTGSIIAALFAAWFGLMALALSNIVAGVDVGFRTAITLHSGVGPYSGKELLMFAAWFVSWPVLDVALRNKSVELKRWFGIFLAGMLVAVILLGPPVFDAIADLF
jgi:hypothetical protein